MECVFDSASVCGLNQAVFACAQPLTLALWLLSDAKLWTLFPCLVLLCTALCWLRTEFLMLLRHNHITYLPKFCENRQLLDDLYKCMEILQFLLIYGKVWKISISLSTYINLWQSNICYYFCK